MPIHDWTRVTAGIFHHFHVSWIAEIARTLNAGLLPGDYYALAEQTTGPMEPDVLTLEMVNGRENGSALAANNDGEARNGLTAVAVAPPRVRFTAETEMANYVSKRRTIVIRHSTDDRIVALVEVVLPGNKSSRRDLQKFVAKAAAALERGFHLLILDLHPPTSRDPQGIHGAIWEEITGESFQLPADKPLTLAAYDAGDIKRAFIEPVAVGDELPPMPLFLEPGQYVNVPLAATYETAFESVPLRWRRIL